MRRVVTEEMCQQNLSSKGEGGAVRAVLCVCVVCGL